MSLLLALAATTAVQAPVTEPRGLSLREAQTLPARTVLERVLGATGGLYTEVQRPGPAITRGRAFVIAFASAPRSAGYPGVCVADTLTVDFGPAADGPATSVGHVQSFNRNMLYRIVGDTAPPAGGWTDSYRRMLATRCAAAGPVLSRPDRAAPGFFGGYASVGGPFGADHAYFGARALVMASSGASPPAQCEDHGSGPAPRLCDDPSALLRNLPMERFLGFWIDRCEQDSLELCVAANFSRGPGTGPGFIEIRLRTSLSEPRYLPPEFALREVRIRVIVPIP